MKNIRGALFVLSLSIILLFNSTTIAQAKAPTIWVCKDHASIYTLIKFKSLKVLAKDSGYRNTYYGFNSAEDIKKWETKILNQKNCKYKIEKQSYTRLYNKLRNDFKIKKVYGKWDPKNVRKTSEGYYERTKGPSLFEYYAKDIGKDTLAKLSKKYNEYPLKNLASTTQTQQVAKKEKKVTKKKEKSEKNSFCVSRWKYGYLIAKMNKSSICDQIIVSKRKNERFYNLLESYYH